MVTSIVDLRYKMDDVLKALDRNEDIKILSRGKVKAIIKNVFKTKSKKKKVCDHPFFNCLNDEESVEEQMNRIRGSRYNDI